MKGFHFAQLSDIHYGNPGRPGKPLNHRAAMAAALAELKRRPPAFVLFTGDMTDNAAAGEIAEFRADAAAFPVPVHYTPGNHDVGDQPTPASVAAYESVFGPACSAFTYEACAFLSFNSMLPAGPETAEPAVKQLEELDRLFAAHAHLPKRIVFTHVPLFLERSDEPKNYWNIEPAYRAKLLALFDRHRPIAVLSGHAHRNLHSFHNGVLYQTTTALSFQLGTDRMGFRLWLVGAAGVSSEFVPVG